MCYRKVIAAERSYCPLLATSQKRLNRPVSKLTAVGRKPYPL
jgi:hypothetical protein